MPELKEPLIAHWYRALHSEFGVEIATSDPTQVRNKLYAARHEAKDTDLDIISVCVSPFDATKLWLVKRELKVPD
jgi:hypothetical protein